MDVAVVEMVVIVGILDVVAAITAAMAAATIAAVVTSPSGMGIEMASAVDIMRDGKMP